MAIAGAVNGSAPLRVTTDEMDINPEKNPHFLWLNPSGMGIAAGVGNAALSPSANTGER